MTTGKTIALTRQTFVGKVMSLLFNKLSRLVIGESNGNPLQYSCLENPMDGGVWWAAVHGVTRSRTRLSTQASLDAPTSDSAPYFFAFPCLIINKVHLPLVILFRNCMSSEVDLMQILIYF